MTPLWISCLVALFAIAVVSAETICYGQDPTCAPETATCVEAVPHEAGAPGDPLCVQAANTGIFQTYSTFIKTGDVYSIYVYLDEFCNKPVLTTDLGADVCTEVSAPLVASWYVVVSNGA